MLKNSGKKVREKFLKKFTAELIEVRRKELEARKKAEKEKARIRKEVDVEKLKKKYIKEPEILKPAEKQKPKPVVRPALYAPPAVLQPKQMPIQPHPFPAPLQFVATPPAVHPAILSLGKIDAFVRDPAVMSIECPGPDKNLILKKGGQTIKSDITLRKEEIDAIVQEFSEKARIPLVEGMLRARVENLQISAVISKIAASRFIITKILGLMPAGMQRQIMPAVRRPFVMQPQQFRQPLQPSQPLAMPFPAK